MAVVSDIEIRLRADIARLQNDMTAARRSVDSAMNGITRAAESARNALAGVGVGIGLGEIVRISDEYTKFTAQLKLATEGTSQYGQALSDVRRIANSSQADLAATGTLYARIANGTKDLGISQQRVADIVEATNLSLKVSGATSQESASAILQLSQAFGSGALRGEEFNAVNEAAPRLLRAVADGLGVPVGALKNMASEGKLTAEVLANVLPKALGQLRGEADQVQTIAGAFTLLKNNVLEFVGTTSQSSGTVSVLAQGISLLANNLDIVAGAVVTLTAARLVAWLESGVSATLSSVAANRTLAASNVNAAQSTAMATAQASLLANARLAEVRAATLAASAETQLALTTNGLIPAQARAAAAAEAHALAMSQLAIAQRAASVGTTALSGVIAALGGPIGAVITVLGLAATAWSVYQSRQEEANRKASENTEQSTIEIIGSLEKQNAKLRERIELSKQAGLADVAKSGGAGAERLASILKQINDLKAKGNQLDAGDQVTLITLQGIYNDLAGSIKRTTGTQAELDATGKAATDLVAVRERLAGVNKQYLADLQVLQTAREKGAITEKEYISTVTKLAQETWKSSEAGKEAEKQSKASEKQAKASAKAVQSEADAYSSLLDKIYGKEYGQAADFQENIALLYKGYLAGKQSLSEYVTTVEEYIKQQKSSLQIEKDRLKVQQQIEDFQKGYSEGLAVTSDVFEKNIEDARKEAESNIELTRTFGMTKTAIEQEEVARLKNQLAHRADLGLTLDEIDYLHTLIALKEQSANSMASRDQMEQAQRFWTDIDKTAHDTFVSIADGGKGAFQRLKDSAKNVFFDWLYQMTLKKWIINIGASTDGVAAVAGLTNGNSSITQGAGLLNTASNLYGALTGGATLAGGVGSGFLGSVVGGLNGAGVGSGLTSSLGLSIGTTVADALGPTIAGALSTGISGLAAALPWVGGAVAVYTLAKAAFSMGPKQYADNSTLAGSLGSGGFNGTMNTAYTQKGGWLRSDKNGVDKKAVDAMQASGLTAAYDAIKQASTSYAEVLGLNADSIANRTQAVSIALGKDEAANQKAISDFFVGVGDTIAGELLPTIGMFQQQGENTSTTLQRLASDFQIIDGILATMGTDSQTAFKSVGSASIEARERLIAFAGGLDALASQTQYYNDNFLSQAERVAIIQKPLNEQLTALGYAGITTADQFKEAVQGLVSSGALATEQGAKTYATLLAIAPKFKTVADYLKEVADTAKETADGLAKAALEANETLLRGMVDKATDSLQKAVEAQKNTVEAAYQSTISKLDTQIGALNDTISDTVALGQALRGAMRGIESPDQAIGSRMAAQAQVTAALAIARASGGIPSLDDLKDALSTLGNDASNSFSSLADYQRDVARTNNELEQLGGLTDSQLSAAEQQLKVLQDTKTQAQAAYEAEIQRLDGIVNAVLGVDTSVMSLAQAMAKIKVAQAALAQGATPSNPTGSNLSVEQLYRTVLGRDGEQAGIDFWKGVFGEVVDTQEYADFIKGAMPELNMQPQVPVVNSPMQTGTMNYSSANLDQQAINERVEQQLIRVANATEQLANQFNNVSAGGNALLMEPA